MSDMAATTLSVTYDGPALDAGLMDVRDLAPALLALGQMLEQANRVVNGDTSQLSVRVKAGFKAGSFEIDLDLVQSFLVQARDLLAGTTSTAIANLIAHLGFAGGATAGLFTLLKRLRGRKPARAVVLEDGNVSLELPDGETVTVPRLTLNLYLDVRVRSAIAEALKPLAQSGIDSFSVRPAGTPKESPAITVGTGDLAAFDKPTAEDQPLPSQEHQAAFSIVNLSFQDDNKWRLYDGQNSVWAKIEDADFLRRVNANEIAFSKGDILVCDVSIDQWQTASGLRTETRIIRVKDHRSAARQLGLTLDTP